MGLVFDIHHVALGVSDLERTQAFYAQHLGFTKTISAFKDIRAPIMGIVARAPELAFDGSVLEHSGGGLQLEFIHRTQPPARPIRPRLSYGDIGLNALVIVTEDIAKIRDELSRTAGPDRLRSSPSAYGPIHLLDPEGNLVRIEAPAPGAKSGARGILFGVADLQRSIEFYREYLGFAAAVPVITERQVDLATVFGPGTEGTLRSARLDGVGGNTWIELVEAVRPRGRSLPFGSSWGDFGPLQTCFSCADASHIAARMTESGMSLLCPPHPAGPGPAAQVGEFFYALDPDGAPIEFLHLPG